MSRPGLVLAALLAAAALALPASGGATEEYADCTGSPCSLCHEAPGGGGALTGAGAAFAGALDAGGAPPAGRWARLLVVAVRYLHVIAAFMWFGTILYVHLVLKPAYAASGLPRGELRLGWAGILLVGVTGGVLTALRIDSAGDLLHTRFGLLLSAKIALYSVMAGTALVVTTVVGPRLGRRRARPGHPGSGEFTEEDLAGFDGREGRRALVAVDGKVYDLSGSRLWRDGSHLRRHGAGQDLTAALAQAPHDIEKLLEYPEVGALVPAAEPGGSPHQRAFYFMAYLNLGIVAAVLLVLATWRG